MWLWRQPSGAPSSPSSGFYRVQPDEQGTAPALGKVWKLTNPGLTYNLSAP
jgi:regulator of protease activity HflC (stomatin/prohibitin superfamily)